MAGSCYSWDFQNTRNEMNRRLIATLSITPILLGFPLESAAQADIAVLEEIVVRAQLRKQALDEVPLSITVLAAPAETMHSAESSIVANS